MIVSTYPDKDTVSKIASKIVQEGTAACVNVSEISSFYSWDGKLVEDEGEQIAIFKTVSSKKSALKERIRQTHPYDVPEIAEIHVSDINEPYLRWMASASSGASATDTAAGTVAPADAATVRDDDST